MVFINIFSKGWWESGQAHYIKKSGERISSKIYPRIFFSILFVAMLVLAFLVTKPFLAVLITGAIIAYLVNPLYAKLLHHVKNRHVAAFIVALSIVILITLPFIGVLGLVANEAVSTYSTIDQHHLGSNFLRIACKNQDWASCRAIKFFVAFLPDRNLDYYMQSAIEKITTFIIDNFSKFLLSIPEIMLNLFILAFVVYYLLKDGETISKKIKNILPLKESHKQNVFARFHDATYAVFYGNIAVAVAQGFLGSIGFFVFGTKSPILWGSVMAIFALLPYFGTAIVWLPAALNLIFEGYLQDSNSLIVKGFLLIIYGIFIVSLADNFLKPKIISKKADIHPILVLLGVFGGLELFGFLGFILGPIILAILVTFIEIYEEEKAGLEKYF